MDAKKKNVPADMTGVGRAVEYVQESLKGLKLKGRNAANAVLLAEETLVELAGQAPEGSEIRVQVQKRMGTTSILLSAPGEKLSLTDAMDFGLDLESGEIDRETESAIRGLLLRSFKDRIRCKYKNGVNTVLITVETSARRSLYLTLGALALAVAAGLLLKAAAPESFTAGLNEYLLVPGKKMFLNALKMVVGPVVFFSIVSCIAGFGDLSEFGKIGAKILGMYVLTTLFAIAVGLGVSFLVSPGDPGMLSDAAAGTAVDGAGISMLDTIVNIVPSNIVRPFLESDMLQIIFIAVLCGAAAGMIGSYSKPLQAFFEACSTLFLKVTTIIIQVIPIAVFCSITSLILTTGADTLLSLLGMMGTVVLGMFLMVLVYAALVLLSGLNPLTYLKKYLPVMLATFSLSSSSAAMPLNMDACQNRLGVSPKVCSFSIPLGATVNMDGSCVYLAVAGMFLAKVYGVEIEGSTLVAMIFSILVLSIGAPGIPGAAFVCLSALLTAMGVPAEAVGLVMGIDPILSMFRAMSNTAGDAAVALVVAKSEKLVDTGIFNS